MLGELKGKSIEEVLAEGHTQLASVPSGGGGGGGGGAAPAAGGGGDAPAEAAPVEEEEEEDEDMDFDLFGKFPSRFCTATLCCAVLTQRPLLHVGCLTLTCGPQVKSSWFDSE